MIPEIMLIGSLLGVCYWSTNRYVAAIGGGWWQGWWKGYWRERFYLALCFVSGIPAFLGLCALIVKWVDR